MSKRLLLLGAGASLFTKIINIFAQFLVIMILTKNFSLETVGIYSFSLSIVEILFFINKMGSQNSLQYFIPRNNKKEENDKVFFFFIILSNFIAFLYMALLILFKDVVQGSSTLNFGMLLLLSISFIFLNYIEIVSSLFRALKNINISTLINKNNHNLFLLITLSVFLLFNFNNDIVLIGSAMIVSSFLYMIYSYIITKKYGFILTKDIFKSLNTKYIKEVLTYSLPVMFTGIVYILLSKVDQVIVGYYIDNESVAKYMVMAKISTLVLVIVQIFSNMFAPILSEKFHQNKINEAEESYHFINNIIWFLSIPVLVFVFLFAKDLILLLSNESYLDSINVLYILTFGAAISALTGNTGLMLQMGKKQKFEFINTILALIINLVLSIILVKTYGIIGVAFSTMSALVIVNLIKIYAIKKFFNIDFLNKDIIKILLFLTIILPLIYHLQLNNYITFTIFATMYIIFFYFFILDKSAKEKITQLKRKIIK
jgi:O-antigen/teichoic acid export membrane protein